MKKQILLDNLEQLETKEYTKITPILVPETWEDLKELCKELECISIHDVGGYIKLSINNKLIYFFIAGDWKGKIDITNNTFLERFCLTKKATPAQMWQIIKSLIGDER